MECLIGAFIEFDSGVVNGFKPLVSFFDALHHPLFEFISDEGVDDVADVRPGHLPDLPHDRKGSLDSRIGEAEVEDEVQGEVLVLGHSDDPYVFAGDGLKKVRIRKRDLQSCLRRQGPSCARW